MNAEDPTADAVRIVLRGADRQVLAEAARSRKQSLAAFLSETLACAAVDLRQGPVVRVSWLDVYSRRSGLADDAMDDDTEPIRWTMPRAPRRVYLPTGPAPGKR